MANNDPCVSEVTSHIERNRKQPSTSSNDECRESTSSLAPVTNHQLCGLKRFSSTPALPVTNDVGFRTVPASNVQIPIVGYEVMEERARFTVYKLRIGDRNHGDSWFVFRRYTDFVRLHSKLKNLFPKLGLTLPRKRWFGDNFDSRFIEQRVNGLQSFIDSITHNEELMNSAAVREFFCLDQPPSYIESSEENRAIFEALEETIYHLRRQVLQRETEYESLTNHLRRIQEEGTEFALYVREVVKSCNHCKIHLQHLSESFQRRRDFHKPLCTSSPLSSSSISSMGEL